MLDVVIIGAGPIGLCCAIEAKKNKLSYVVIDKGCLVNSLYNYPKNMTFFSTSDKLEIGEVPFSGLRFSGERFDCGSKIGFLQANIAFALQRDELGQQLKSWLTERVK